MATAESRHFDLSIGSLRAISGWVANCAEKTLPVYEKRAESDLRPRAAIEGAREFARGGKRVAALWNIVGLSVSKETPAPLVTVTPS